MKLVKLNLDIDFQPLTTKQSRAISAAINVFTQTTNADAGDAAVAQFLTNQMYYLLTTVYKEQMAQQSITLPSKDDFEDYVTVGEVYQFLTGQVDTCGANDFLMRTLNGYLQGIGKLTAQIDQMVDANVTKAVSSITSR